MSDPDRIGKYRIVERIGRGGMGTIFKAHDPILNRAVALKVISADVDLTEDVRVRFFREAQACARLSHPNIITVYDMGEDGGRMFIVMELLEGTELRRLIDDRAPLPLEDRLSIMTQVCDGLHYAHQRGIVHRDIKPSNIMRLPNGQVKILDFGIAQMENFHETLTRTGLIMGTLQYVAPEQVRGRADHRADIFSVGAVLYEFLSLRPPFRAKDALQLLEQLRTEEPTPLHVVDPTIPSDLSDIAARAMRKDPAERTPDLAQMRAQIERVQRTLGEEARRVQARINTQRDQLQRLQVAIASHTGSATAQADAAMMDDSRHLASLQALEADLLAQIQAAKATLERAAAVAPAFERASELLESGQLDEAIAELEGIVAQMPEHARAAAALARARSQADEDRRRQLAIRLVREARAALAASGYAQCLDILQRIAELRPPAETLPEITALRDMAEAAVATQNAAPAGREEAEGRALEGVQEARQREQHQDDGTDDDGTDDDRTRLSEGNGPLLVRPGPTRMGEAIPDNPAPARGRGRRWLLPAAAVLGGLAVIALVLSYSRSAHVGPAPSSVASSSPSPAPVAPAPAGVAGASDAGPQAVRPPVRGAGTRPDLPPPERSVLKETDSTKARPDRGAPPPAKRAEERATESRAPEARRDARQAEAQMASARSAAEKSAAAFYAPKLLAAAQASEREAADALHRSDFAGAVRLLAEARSGYQAAAQEARREADTERQMAPLKASVEQARDTALARRRQALAADAERLAMDVLRGAETRHAEADGLAARQSFAAALQAYGDAAERYAEAALRARAASGK